MCPIYEWYCSACDVTEETLCKIDQNVRPPCPVCEYFMEKVQCPGGGFKITGIGVYKPTED
jgi:predicted nucleic acid-binding Zn ribbon protein